MSKSINEINLMGHLGQNPEIKVAESGMKIATFSIATSDSYKNKEGEKVESTEWHRIIAFDKLAELIEKYVLKGAKVFVKGKQCNRKYEDKEGVTKYISEVILKDIWFLDNKEDRPKETSSYDYEKAKSGSYVGSSTVNSENDNENIPF